MGDGYEGDRGWAGWKVALGNRGMTVEAARQCVERPERVERAVPNEFHAAILLVPVFFRTALPCCGGYRMERGETQLHDAVEINYKNGATTENQGSTVKFMAKGCILMTVYAFYLT